jgi:hypothetical protein
VKSGSSREREKILADILNIKEWSAFLRMFHLFMISE